MHLPMIGSLDEIVDNYAVLLCDIWGVVHDGIRPYAEAAAALCRSRKKGLVVVLVTNAARPRGVVEKQLHDIGVPDDAWDRIVTSGDVTRELIRASVGKIFHLGQDRNLDIYEGLDAQLVGEAEASVVVCTGLPNEVGEPADYAELLQRLRTRDLPFICANPDIAVERGSRRLWCAGALARDYARIGGRVVFAGKPYRPIYEAAFAAASDAAGRTITSAGVLAIGDGVATDLGGARRNGIDALYISGGIDASVFGRGAARDSGMLSEFLTINDQHPVAILDRLR